MARQSFSNVSEESEDQSIQSQRAVTHGSPHPCEQKPKIEMG